VIRRGGLDPKDDVDIDSFFANLVRVDRFDADVTLVADMTLVADVSLTKLTTAEIHEIIARPAQTLSAEAIPA
jgi:hypothetical protein